MKGTLEFTLYTDGASRGNPGPAAIGYAIYDVDGNLVERNARTVGRRTNNEAEYEALIWGLETTHKKGAKSVRAYSDSELVVMQIKGEYRIAEERLRQYADRVFAAARLFESFEINHVARENPRTRMVDEMVNAALDQAGF